MIFPCLYNAPILYYALLYYNEGNLFVEQHDHYTKQTYRNRCRILGGNGPIEMVIPIVKNHGVKTILKDVKIDYDTPWQAIHWKSINSAYASSPYFEYMQDTFSPLYNQKETFLVDLNIHLLNITLELLGWDLHPKMSMAYVHIPRDEDFREAIHPKKEFMIKNYQFHPEKYHQVFTDRFGFIENLSILDLLFNEGQNASTILKASLTNS